MRCVLHIITGLGGGGAEAVLYRLCTHDADWRHHVISLGDGGKYGPLLAEAGVNVTCLEMPRGRITAKGLWRMWRTIRRIRPYAVQTWMYHANLLGGLVARLAGQQNINWGIRQSGLNTEETSRSTILVNEISARLSSRVPRQIICCAKQACKRHSATGYAAERMLVIQNGYDFSVFQPDPTARSALRAYWGLDEAETAIGLVGRYHPFKDHANLLRALALLHDRGFRTPCFLIGAGMDRNNAELAGMIKSLGLAAQVRLMGARDDIPAVMNALDLHVLASSVEGFPNVLAEAMACGTPCVSTDVGDATEIVGDTGRIVPPRDPTALAEAIAAMLAARAGSDWRARQESARRHVVNSFSIERMVERYHEAWLKDRSAGRRHNGPVT